ncbi:MAG: site-specific DNA-methyltransferase [Rhodospirillales bacterium]|nr:site-specific DNA-methyltransferase [Rhodospirillales bacterium]
MTELQFKGKEFVYNHHLAVPFRPLLPDERKGIGPVALDGNLIVQGDNLHALKALLPRYAGKVDCVFIDPPYNTGNEGWCYNDKVNAPMIREWLEANPIGIDDGLRHDKWCAMMWPRLRLLHDLLSEDGVIFVTIDDYEVHRLRSLLDEVFGGQNHVATVVDRLNPKGRHLGEFFAKTHEYILVYAKNISWLRLNGLEKSEAMVSEYNREDEVGPYRPIELRNRNSAFNPQTRPNLYYPIYVNSEDGSVSLAGDAVYTEEALPLDGKGQPTCWTWGKEKFRTQNKLLFAEQTRAGTWRVFRKDYLHDEDGSSNTTKPKSIWLDDDLNMDASRLTVRQVLGENAFDFPKPVPLVQRCIELVGNENAIILDSFAGSGTTAHAVLAANKRDGGNRRFILVEMEDYADRLTAERVRRAIKGYAFSGRQRRELLREKITWSALQKAGKLIESVEKLENLQAREYDAIKKTVKDGALIVTGEKAVEERAEGLGGRFTYCRLGDPLALDRVLQGTGLPSYGELAAVLFNMATNEALDPARVREADFYLGKTEGRQVWLLYKPDLDWLKSHDAALTLKKAGEIAAADPGRRHLVFAPARHVSQRMLAAKNLPVEFVPLPFALYRIDRS